MNVASVKLQSMLFLWVIVIYINVLTIFLVNAFPEPLKVREWLVWLPCLGF